MGRYTYGVRVVGWASGITQNLQCIKDVGYNGSTQWVGVPEWVGQVGQ